MIYITDLRGTTMPVQDPYGCIKQVEVLFSEDFTLSNGETVYWKHLYNSLQQARCLMEAGETLNSRRELSTAARVPDTFVAGGQFKGVAPA